MTAAVVRLRDEASPPEERVRALNEALGKADAPTILRKALHEEFAGQIALVSSFGAESAVLLHLVAEVDRNVPVIFLETEKHFAQTTAYRRKLAARLGLTDVRDVRPGAADLTADDPHGDLWRRDSDACCNIRKVKPLTRALGSFGAWITGRKAFHGGDRLALPVFEWSGTHVKVNPLVTWRQEDIAGYMAEHDLPPHPLVSQGYRSIGCWPCTMPSGESDDVRAGRWGGSRRECGIHQR